MKKNQDLIEYLRSTMNRSKENYDSSTDEALVIKDLYENRHWTKQQLQLMQKVHIPAETYNIIKIYTDILIGYYGRVVNDIKVTATQPQYIVQASLLSDIVKYTMNDNRMKITTALMKRDAFLYGICCAYITIVATGLVDNFGRAERKIKIDYVPVDELQIDPDSRAVDYSDARYIHRTKFITRIDLKLLFPKKKSVIDTISNQEGHEFINRGIYEPISSSENEDRDFDQLALTHSIFEDDKGRRWSVYWIGDYILEKKDMTYLAVRFPYLVTKTTDSQEVAYYGVFHTLISTQDTLNQFLSRILLKAITTKLYVEAGATKNIDKLNRQENSPTSIVELEKQGLAKIRKESNIPDMQSFSLVFADAEKRVQKTLHINDSMLGTTFASDSGRKVSLQQEAGALALEFQKEKISVIFSSLGEAICKFAQQYYTTEQVLPMTDEIIGTRYIQINKPQVVFTGKYIDGMPETSIVYVPQIDPASREEVIDNEGLPIYVPLPTEETDIMYLTYQVSITSVPYNNEAEKNQLLGEVVMNGELGRLIIQNDPASALNIFAYIVRDYKIRIAEPIYELLMKASEKVAEQHAMQQQLSVEQQQANISATIQGASQSQQKAPSGNVADVEKMNPKSQQLKIGQNGVN